MSCRRECELLARRLSRTRSSEDAGAGCRRSRTIRPKAAAAQPPRLAAGVECRHLADTATRGVAEPAAPRSRPSHGVWLRWWLRLAELRGCHVAAAHLWVRFESRQRWPGGRADAGSAAVRSSNRATSSQSHSAPVHRSVHPAATWSSSQVSFPRRSIDVICSRPDGSESGSAGGRQCRKNQPRIECDAKSRQ